MDILAFISEVIKAISWPVTIIILVLFLRKPISNLIPLLQKLKYKDFEMEFAKTVERVVAQTEKLSEAQKVRELPLTRRERALKLNELSPKRAIVQSWKILEEALLDKAKNLVAAKRVKIESLTQAISLLQESNQFSAEFGELIQGLRIIRNQAAHSPDYAISQSSVYEYSTSIEKIIMLLDQSNTQ